MKKKQFDWSEFIDHSRVCVYCNTRESAALFIKEMTATLMTKRWYWCDNLKPRQL